MTIIMEGSEMMVGVDFVDAVSGKRASHGAVELIRRSTKAKSKYEFVSTLTQEDTYKAIKTSANSEGLDLGSNWSQAL